MADTSVKSSLNATTIASPRADPDQIESLAIYLVDVNRLYFKWLGHALINETSDISDV